MVLDNSPQLVAPLGQQNRPDTAALRSYFQGIFQRQYYTESGPLVRRLESEIGQLLGVGHVVCVSNPTVAWLMLLEAAELAPGMLHVPVTASRPLLEALQWINRPCHFHDISAVNGYRPHLSDIDARIGDAIAALIGVNQWGGACDLLGLRTLSAERGIPLFLDSSEAFACRLADCAIGAWGSAEVFSFDAANLINGAGSACITTQDEALADRLRCMRSSGGVVRHVRVNKTVNGRMSEAQAAYALMGLERIDYWVKRNKDQHDLYREILHGLPGLQFLSAQGVTQSNCQQAIIALTQRRMRDSVLALLQAQGIKAGKLSFGTSTNLSCNYPEFCNFENTTLALPLGSDNDLVSIEAICAIVTTKIVNSK
jgi:dTDP-4-amino-4,6-dideoxygalactose transaminase